VLLVAVTTVDAAVYILENAWLPLAGVAVISIVITAWVWRTHRRHKIVAFVAVLAMVVNVALAVHAGFAVADALRSEPDPGAVDAATLNTLQDGDEYSRFEAALGPDTATIRTGLTVTWGGRTYQLQDRVFVMNTAYVEAFVDQNNTVDAYTVTARLARTPDAPQGLKFRGDTYDLGKTPLAMSQVRGLAGACGAHIVAFYLISGTDEAANSQIVAIGLTSSGLEPASDYTSLPKALCPAPTTSAYEDFGHGTAAWAAGGAKVTDTSNRYLMAAGAIPGVGANYYTQQAPAYAALHINTVAITAPGFPMLQQFFSLHPQQVAAFDPDGGH